MLINAGYARYYASIIIITVDTKQGYHQVAVQDRDVEKLTFFVPNHKKYDFKVISFWPVNAPEKF